MSTIVRCFPRDVRRYCWPLGRIGFAESLDEIGEKWSLTEQRERDQLRATRARVALELQRTRERTGGVRSWRYEKFTTSRTSRNISSTMVLALPAWKEVEDPLGTREVNSPETIAFEFCRRKTSGCEPGSVADAGATCLILAAVDTKYAKAVPPPAKTVSEYLVEGAKRFVRRRVRLRCDGKPATVALGAQ